MVSKQLSLLKSNHRVIYHDFIYFSFIVAAFGRIDYSLFTHNFVTSLVKSSLRWCFLFSRCLIYKVHVPHAEQSLLYQAQFCLSRTFFRRFRPPSLDPLLFIAVKQLIKNSRIIPRCQQLFLIFIITVNFFFYTPHHRNKLIRQYPFPKNLNCHLSPNVSRPDTILFLL